MAKAVKGRTAVLVSGSGTLLESMIQKNRPISLVVADKPCRGLELAKANGIEYALLPRATFGWIEGKPPNEQKCFNRESWSRWVASYLFSFDISISAMAGFMTIFDPVYFQMFPGLTLNIHPSLLPNFKGEHAVRDALAAGVPYTGTTIHVATKKLDDGPLVAQYQVPILSDDDEASLHERIKIVERTIYWRVISAVHHAGIETILSHGIRRFVNLSGLIDLTRTAY